MNPGRKRTATRCRSDGRNIRLRRGEDLSVAQPGSRSPHRCSSQTQAVAAATKPARRCQSSGTAGCGSNGRARYELIKWAISVLGNAKSNMASASRTQIEIVMNVFIGCPRASLPCGAGPGARVTENRTRARKFSSPKAAHPAGRITDILRRSILGRMTGWAHSDRPSPPADTL